VADRTGCCAIEVVAIDEGAARFYKKYGFVEVDNREPLRLYISMKNVIDII
jgi:hypothetical protein